MLNIFFIDDNRDDFELAKSTLRNRKDIFFEYFSSLSSLKDYAEKLVPNIIVCDYNLPDSTGEEIFYYANRCYPNVPFIMYSGSIGEERAVELMRLGITDYVLKNNYKKLPLAIDRSLEEAVQQLNLREAERQLRESEEKYRRIVEDQNDFILRYDPAGSLLFVNNSFVSFARRIGLNLNETNYFNDILTFEGDYAKNIILGLTQQSSVYSRISKITLRNQDYYIRWTDRALFDERNNCTGFQAVGVNVTELIESEISLKERNLDLLKLSQHIEMVREEERKKISRELHDEVGQQLIYLKLLLNSIRQDESKTTIVLDEADEFIKTTINSFKRILSDLRPPRINDCALFESLEWLFQNIMSRYTLKYRFECQSSERLDFNVNLKLQIYRIVQESLNNIVKHSNATEVSMTISEENEKCIICLKDDGQGFDYNRELQKGTNGLFGMRERSKIIGASLIIDSAIGKGTKIELSF